MEGTEILVKINVGWHPDYIMAMSMSGAVRTCVTHHSAASKSDVTAVEQHLEKLGRQEAGIAWSVVPEELTLCALHSLTRPRLPFWGLSQESCFSSALGSTGSEDLTPTATHHVHEVFYYSSGKVSWEEPVEKFWLCLSSFLPLELTWCGSRAAERLPGAILWLEGHGRDVCVTLILQTAGTCPGHGATQQKCSYLDCSCTAEVPRKTGKPLGAAGTDRRCHFPVVIAPGCRWMSHKLKVPLRRRPRRPLGGRAWLRQRYLVNFSSSERKLRCLGDESNASSRDWVLLSPQSLQEWLNSLTLSRQYENATSGANPVDSQLLKIKIKRRKSEYLDLNQVTLWWYHVAE